METQYLFIPGPTPIPDSVLQAMAQQPVSHKSEEFRKIFKKTSEHLRDIFKTENDVLTLTCSGTGAADAAAQNLISPGDKALVLVNGRFAKRWSAMIAGYGAKVVELHAPWGDVFKSEDVEQFLKENADAKTVWMVHSETSTGILNDVEQFSKIIHEHTDALVCVDAVSSLAANDVRTDEWMLDVVFSASQKGLMSPAGLSFVTLSPRAWNTAEAKKSRGMYFDFLKARESLRESLTPWTPAIHSIYAIHRALFILRRQGLDAVFARHARNSLAVREGMKSLGLEIFNEKSPSNALTPAELPDENFIQLLKNDFGIIVASGQDDWKKKVFRIGHLGWYNNSDIAFFMENFEKALLKTGREFEKGAGILAANAIFKTE